MFFTMQILEQQNVAQDDVISMVSPILLAQLDVRIKDDLNIAQTLQR